MENEYRTIAGKPSEPYEETIGGFAYYLVDPGQSAYSDIFQEESRFLERIGKSSRGFWLTQKGDALYNMRLAIRYGDEKAALKYLGKYQMLGGKPEEMGVREKI